MTRARHENKRKRERKTEKNKNVKLKETLDALMCSRLKLRVTVHPYVTNSNQKKYQQTASVDDDDAFRQTKSETVRKSANAYGNQFVDVASIAWLMRLTDC